TERVAPRKRIPNHVELSSLNLSSKEWATPDWFRSDKDVDVSIIVPLYKSQDVVQKQIATWDLSDDGLTKEIIYCDDACPNNSHLAALKSWEARKGRINAPVGR